MMAKFVLTLCFSAQENETEVVRILVVVLFYYRGRTCLTVVSHQRAIYMLSTTSSQYNLSLPNYHCLFFLLKEG